MMNKGASAGGFAQKKSPFFRMNFFENRDQELGALLNQTGSQNELRSKSDTSKASPPRIFFLRSISNPF